MSNADGMTYAPKGKPAPVVGPGEFRFAAMHLDHGHINGQCQGLIEAGADLVAVYDPDPIKVERFRKAFPQSKAVDDPRKILEDSTIRLIAAAAVPCDRGPLGVRVMDHGKDYFTDKAPFTSLAQLAAARAAVARTGRKYAVYYSERIHVECAVEAGRLVQAGAIGRVIQVLGLGPHRLNAPSRPGWFFTKAQYGGILTDIGSHQLEQFLFFTGATAAKVTFARVANHAHPAHPELEDFGEVAVVSTDPKTVGASGYHRVDWFTPAGLSTWGDGRLVLLGTEGTIELRKYVDVAAAKTQDHLILVDGKGEHRWQLHGQVGFPFFGQLIRDCLDRSETAMTQDHAFLAAELCLHAQALADAGRA